MIFGQLKGGREELRVLGRLREAGGDNEKLLIPFWVRGNLVEHVNQINDVA